MKLAIISDIHDNLTNLKTFFDFCRKEKIDEIICCGDVCNSETLKFLSQNFESRIYLAQGNQELYRKTELINYHNIEYHERLGWIEIGGVKTGFCHEPYLIEMILEQSKCDMVFYGHTHKPWIEKKAGVTMVNPGTLGGVFQKATFALWEPKTGRLELKILSEI